MGEDFATPKLDLRNAHRIWAHGEQSHEVLEKFRKFFSNKFKNTLIYENNTKHNSYKGIKLKPLTYEPKNNLDYEVFIQEKCTIDYKYRISYYDFFTCFVKWKEEKEPYYKLKFNYKREIQEYLEKVFAGGRVHLSSGVKSTHLNGIWGMGIENNNGLKPLIKHNKKIKQFDAITGEFIKDWESLRVLAHNLNIPESTMSNYVRFQKTVGNFKYQYEKIEKIF